MKDLENIVSVVKCGWRRANEYLEHGYILIAVQEWTDEKSMKPLVRPDGSEHPRTFVNKGTTFIVGRIAETPSYNPSEYPAAAPSEVESASVDGVKV